MATKAYLDQLAYDIEDIAQDRSRAGGDLEDAKETVRKAERIYETLLSSETEKREIYFQITGEVYYG